MSLNPAMLFFHCVAAAQFFFTFYYLANSFHIPKTKDFPMFHGWGGHYRFLTNWNLFMQAVFFTICLINDVIGSNDVHPKKTPRVRKLKDFFHASLGFPIATFVTITFWGIYAVDRELVFPKLLDPYFPTWLNHIMHTNVAVFSLVELIISFRKYPSRRSGLTALMSFMLVYLAWTFIIFMKTDRWVYPIMEVLNWPQRIGFLLVLLVFGVILYVTGEALNNFVWRTELDKLKSRQKEETNAAELKALHSIEDVKTEVSTFFPTNI